MPDDTSLSSVSKSDTDSCETDPDVYGIDVICCVVGQCRCQSAWMDGATSCSWVFMCECACPSSIPNDSDNIDFFDMPTKAPNSTEKQNRRHFMVRKDETVRRRIKPLAAGWAEHRLPSRRRKHLFLRETRGKITSQCYPWSRGRQESNREKRSVHRVPIG